MKEKLLKNEQDVLDKLGAQDFRSIKKSQLVQFVSSLPDMDPEIAARCIEQFPEFNKSTLAMVAQLGKTCDSLIADNKDSRNKAIEGYRLILNQLQEELNKHRFMSHKHKREIIDMMIYVAEQIDIINDKNMKHQNDFLKAVGAIALAALGLGAAILGVNINRKS